MAREGNKLDMISSLPDHILCHILSFVPTKYSVRTSMLSTRWKCLFTHVPVLHFDNYELRDDMHRLTRFIQFVNKVMLQYKVVNMQKFVLSGYQCVDQANGWISDAIRRNVRELCIGYKISDIRLPVLKEIYTSKTLVRLEVNGSFIWNVSDDSVCLPSLKTLKLLELDIKTVHIRSSNFPILEYICMACNDFNNEVNVNICVSSLKRLDLRYFKRLNLVLNAPTLEFMNMLYCYAPMKISGSLESLVKANLSMRMISGNPYIKSKYADETQNLIKMVSNVHALTLGDESIQALVSRDSELPIFQNLTCLELRNSTPIKRRLLPDLLESSPNLEVLIFSSGLVFDEPVEMDAMEAVCECVCLSLHLKEVKIECFNGKELEFKTVKYFLKNAKVLNKMTIHLDCKFTSYMRSVSRYMTAQRLLALPRYSVDCNVVVLP